jgi:hypothetical protein
MSHLYHYTSSNGLTGILNDGIIERSGDNVADGDALFGKGVYLTALPPTTDDWLLLANNWDGSVEFYLTKVDNLNYCIEFRKEDLPRAWKTDNSRDVWLVPHNINLRKVPFRVWKR